jgi:leucyl-tRNA synthetase
MTMRYDPRTIEPKWQQGWVEQNLYGARDADSRPIYYILELFPYPSAAGLHVGHPEGYTATDILARYKRLRGFNVLHPMGFDAFGLPAENCAIKTGVHPAKVTAENINNIRKQIKALGFSYDWAREVDTTDPDYYHWTQWIFLKLFERGLAYEAEVPINWCPDCKTGLANEEVKSGRCDRCGHEVTRRGLRQWMLRITKYAERLLAGLDDLDWPEPIKKMQQDWIGRSEGADVDFALVDPPAGIDPSIRIYTTRADTLFGATYMVLSPEHPLVDTIVSDDRREAVTAYVKAAAAKSDLQRTELAKEKSGEFTGAYAINPVNDEKIPIWIADYVLMGYGTGAIMAVPAHDQRDYEFAVKFELPIVQVVQPPDGVEFPTGEAFACDGTAINSGDYTGLSTPEFKRRIAADLEARGVGKDTVRYKLRDWVFSRQRYWGEPIPVVHCAGECGGVVPLPVDQLPLLLPEVEKYEPTGTGESPLAAVEEWVNTTCPVCGGAAKRETNTMPQWAGSCWYYLRYIDNKNSEALVDPEKEKYWMSVDLYVGGAEHAVLHLLYARFWHMVLYDAGVVSTPEPFAALRNQGMILGFSYRYLQDEEGKTYESSAGSQREDGWTLKSDGRVVMEKGVQIKDVRWDGDKPMHPEIEGLALEEYTAKMSKSLGNVVNPDEIIEQYGADVMRLYEMFMGPFEASCPWNTRDIEGVNRFLHRSWRLFDAERRAKDDAADTLQKNRHKTIKKVSSDLETMGFNTAIAQLMTFVNDMTKLKTSHVEDLRALALMVAPFTPHFAEEVWAEGLGQSESVFLQSWPEYDEALCQDAMVTLVVQVNGKKRGTCEVPADVGQDDALAAAREVAGKYVEGKQVIKEIFVARNKLVNLVVRG